MFQRTAISWENIKIQVERQTQRNRTIKIVLMHVILIVRCSFCSSLTFRFAGHKLFFSLLQFSSLILLSSQNNEKFKSSLFSLLHAFFSSEKMENFLIAVESVYFQLRAHCTTEFIVYRNVWMDVVVVAVVGFVVVIALQCKRTKQSAKELPRMSKVTK